jgi:UTP--glucose-1-phosphate uridylyltransferase
MQRRIKKAVFPVAGLGTRFLPATKAVPKEMLTIVDKPVIQIVVDEAREAGIEHFVFVTGRNKSVIEDHFDKQYELEATLRQRNKTAELELLQKSLPRAGETSFTRQQEPLGLGHAVWCARDIVGDEPFALLLPDMLIHARPGCLRQMVDVYEAQGGGNVIAVEEVPWEHVHRYGVVKPGAWSGRAFTIEAMVEKPSGTFQSHHLGPLYPAARDLRRDRETGAGCGRRDPDHRCDDPPADAAEILRPQIHRPDL